MALRSRGGALAAAVLLAPILFAQGSDGVVAPGRSGTSDNPNGRIAFSTGFIQHDPDFSGASQVYTVNPDGSAVRQLTHVPDGSQAGDPDWSPDGRQIAYVDNQSGDFALMVMNGDGTAKHVVSHVPGVNYYTPRWSPDGTRFAVTRCNTIAGYEIDCDILELNADGTGRHLLVGSHVFNEYPDWSPDGRRITFTSDRAGLISAVWAVDAGGGNLRRLTPPDLEAFYPAWSPLGNRILFGNNFDRPHTNTYVVNPDGGRIRQVTSVDHGDSAFFASWSPDGRHIVLISDALRGSPCCGSDLLTANGDGSHLTRIVMDHPRVTYSDWGRARGTYDGSANVAVTRWTGPATSPIASAPPVAKPATSGGAPDATPDGRIVFNSIDCQLWTVNPDGTALQQATHFRKRCAAGSPAWSPDGKRIVFGLFTTDRIALLTMLADGSDVRLVVDDGPGYFDVAPTYSSDGQSILYQRCIPDPPGGCAIYRIGVDGTNPTALTTYPRCGCNRFEGRPEESPDGAWVAFNRSANGAISRIWVMPAAGGPAHPVTPTRFAARWPSWSRDDSTLYFTGGPSQSGYGFKIYQGSTSREQVRELTFSPWPNGDILPDVSPSGRYVAFISDRRYEDASVNELFVMDANGDDQHLVTGAIWANNPDWGTAPLQTGPSERVTPPSAAVRALALRVDAVVERLEGSGAR